MDSTGKFFLALTNPATHDSLKAAIRAFDGSDPVDAANDTEWLAEVMQLRVREIQTPT